jgi:pimeloyl-ACP methyl ester carboxylesterase
VPHASHTRIKNAGHLIAQEKPQELAEEITGYLKDLAMSKQSRSRGARARL